MSRYLKREDLYQAMNDRIESLQSQLDEAKNELAQFHKQGLAVYGTKLKMFKEQRDEARELLAQITEDSFYSTYMPTPWLIKAKKVVNG